MILFPAIDLKGGQCVRLVRGDFATATVFNDDPAHQARLWQTAGFDWLHVVDLDGSLEGRAVNAAAIAAILGSVAIPIQVGGGIRTMADIDAWLGAGVTRVILGTASVRTPALVIEAARSWPSRIAVGLDIREGQVSVAGWAEDSGLDPVEVARRFEGCGVSAVIITDIERDGSLAGVAVDLFGRIADAVDIPVIAAGGMASVADIERLADWRGRSIAGAVLGRALYAGTIDATDALAVAARC